MSSLFVKQLTTLDFSYLCSERGLVGETWLVDVSLSGELNEQGMVFDFGHVKKQIKASLDRLADHRLLVPVASDAISIVTSDDQLQIRLTSSWGIIECACPIQAVLLVDHQEISRDSLKPILEGYIMQELPKNVSGVHLHLYHESIDGAFYHYSHGLKKHLGNCQRIAHGHRSRVEIYCCDERDYELEQYWANIWRDIYIATREDLKRTFRIKNKNYHQFSYISDQGYFELTLPSDHCYLIETDSTIELLAQHLAQEVALAKPEQPVTVVAYEGFNKGSSCSHILYYIANPDIAPK